MHATWRIEDDAAAGTRTLFVDHTGGLSKGAGAAIAAGGRCLLRFLHEDREGDVRLVELAG